MKKSATVETQKMLGAAGSRSDITPTEKRPDTTKIGKQFSEIMSLTDSIPKAR
jgi:hypothetical protein